jgi:hypothetical protein
VGTISRTACSSTAGSPRLADLEIESVEGGFAAVDLLGPGEPLLRRVAARGNGLTAPLRAAVLMPGGRRGFAWWRRGWRARRRRSG